MLTASRKNKSKILGMGKYTEMISDVANNIIPLCKKQVDFGGKIPSGKTPTKVAMVTKAECYNSRFVLQGVAKKMPKEMPIAWFDFASSSFVMFGPQGKQYADFCFPTHDDAHPTSRSAALARAIFDRKRPLLGSARHGGMGQAFQNFKKIMVAKMMMMKYGNEEDYKTTFAVLSEFMRKGKGNEENTIPETSPFA